MNDGDVAVDRDDLPSWGGSIQQGPVPWRALKRAQSVSLRQGCGYSPRPPIVVLMVLGDAGGVRSLGQRTSTTDNVRCVTSARVITTCRALRRRPATKGSVARHGGVRVRSGSHAVSSRLDANFVIYGRAIPRLIASGVLRDRGVGLRRRVLRAIAAAVRRRCYVSSGGAAREFGHVARERLRGEFDSFPHGQIRRPQSSQLVDGEVGLQRVHAGQDDVAGSLREEMDS